LKRYIEFVDAESALKITQQKKPGIQLRKYQTRTIRGMYGSLSQVVEKLFQENIPLHTISMIYVSLILWIDAFYSNGIERTYLKVALSSPIFCRGRTPLLKWIDIKGFESSLMEFASRIDTGNYFVVSS